MGSRLQISRSWYSARRNNTGFVWYATTRSLQLQQQATCVFYRRSNTVREILKQRSPRDFRVAIEFGSAIIRFLEITDGQDKDELGPILAGMWSSVANITNPSMASQEYIAAIAQSGVMEYARRSAILTRFALRLKVIVTIYSQKMGRCSSKFCIPEESIFQTSWSDLLHREFLHSSACVGWFVLSRAAFKNAVNLRQLCQLRRPWLFPQRKSVLRPFCGKITCC